MRHKESQSWDVNADGLYGGNRKNFHWVEEQNSNSNFSSKIYNSEYS